MSEGCRVPVFMDIQNTFGTKRKLSFPIEFPSVLVLAEIVSVREQNGVPEFYIHYVNFNRRLDEWVTVEKMNLKELAPPRLVVVEFFLIK